MVTDYKHDDRTARFGAALGQGLIDAGGRNVTISLQSRAGSRRWYGAVLPVLRLVPPCALRVARVTRLSPQVSSTWTKASRYADDVSYNV